MQSHEIIHKKTHNLEVPGSSPGWSTLLLQRLTLRRRPLFFYTERHFLYFALLYLLSLFQYRRTSTPLLWSLIVLFYVFAEAEHIRSAHFYIAMTIHAITRLLAVEIPAVHLITWILPTPCEWICNLGQYIPWWVSPSYTQGVGLFMFSP